MVQQGQKNRTSGLTRLREKKAVDPIAYELRARLRAVQNELYEIRCIAARQAQRWPHMEGQLRRASLYVLAQVMTAEVACDPLDDNV